MGKQPDTLYISELFASIQGETHLVGLPTFFVRLAGCNMRCSWCDSTFSFSKGNPYSIDEIVQKVQKANLLHACITGGEPLLQPAVYPLLDTLIGLGIVVSLETNGSISVANVNPKAHIVLDIKCPKSNEASKNMWSNLDLLKKSDEIKFVVADQEDYSFAKSIIEKHDLTKKAHILLTPVWGMCNPQELTSWVIEDRLPVRISTQLHKYIWGAEARGV